MVLCCVRWDNLLFFCLFLVCYVCVFCYCFCFVDCVFVVVGGVGNGYGGVGVECVGVVFD